mmetsp:Transcript_26006/g.39948  ORF Transcript_26006/g.39948 Transcript_26006/m.39948 type:complete len:540 (-) Transcript_26006:96-1715(-)
MKVKQGRISLEVEKDDLPSFSTPLPNQVDDIQKNLSSTFGMVGKNDPRSLNDKIFLDFCINDILHFLNEKSFTQFLSFGTLSTPSGKNFARVLLILIKKIDPFFTFKKKTEEDIPLILKNLFYPFVPSKSTFHSLGNPRIWSSLIGCLKWIVELLRYDAQVFNTCSEFPYQRVFSDKSIWKQMTVAYYVFLSGTEEYRKYFQILWALIKNKTGNKKTKQRKILLKINAYQKKFFFILYLLSFVKSSKGKVINEKNFTKHLFTFNLNFFASILDLKEFYNEKTSPFQFESQGKRLKKMEFNVLLKSLKISKIETKGLGWKVENLLKLFKLLISIYRLILLSLKLKFFQVSQVYLQKLTKKLNSFFKFNFSFFEFFKNQTCIKFRKIFSPEIGFSKLFNYTKNNFSSFFLRKNYFFRNLNWKSENVDNFLFVFRKNQYSSKKNLIPMNRFPLSQVDQKIRQTEKDFQIFFQVRENQNFQKIQLKQSLIRNFFIKKIFFLKTFLNDFKFMTLRERNLILEIFLEIKFRFLNKKAIFDLVKIW